MDPKPAALLITDTHLHKDNIDIVEDIWLQAINCCREYQINIIIFLGDFFTARVAQTLAVLLAGKRIISELQKFDGSVLFIPGNHDKVDQSSNESYLDVFDFNINSSLTLIKQDKSIEFDNIIFHFLPYFKEQDKYPELLKEICKYINPIKKNILFTHIAVNGVKNNDGSEVDNGIDPNLFNNFDSVFVGHYHNKSRVGSNIYYIGSAYQANYGEDINKGFTLLYSDGIHKQIKSHFPEFKKINIDVKDLKTIDIGTLKEGNKNVRIIVEGNKEELESIDKEKYDSLGIDIKFDPKLEVQDISKEFKSFNRHNIKQSFDEFCLKNNIEGKDVGERYLQTIIG